MVLLIKDDVVFASGECGDHAEIYTESGGINHGVFFAYVVRKAFFQTLVYIERAVEKRRSRHSCTVFFRGSYCGLLHFRMVGKTHIAV